MLPSWQRRRDSEIGSDGANTHCNIQFSHASLVDPEKANADTLSSSFALQGIMRSKNIYVI